MTTADHHERGLRLLGMWPGPLDVAIGARTRREAAAALAELQATARAAKRVMARRVHPDLVPGARRGDLQALVEAADWIAGLKVGDVWSVRSRSTTRRVAGPVVIESSATGLRITWRGPRRP